MCFTQQQKKNIVKQEKEKGYIKTKRRNITKNNLIVHAE